MDANADDPGGRAASSNPNGRAENVPVRDGENRGAATQQSQPHFAKISRRWAPVLSKLRPMDGPACERLEAVAFESPLHRQSTEKIKYRLAKCHGFCFGLFNSEPAAPAPRQKVETHDFARPSSVKGEVHVLFAQIFASLGTHDVIVEYDNLFPGGWRHPAANLCTSMGHTPSGRTICLHSIAVCPRAQGFGVGTNALATFLRLMSRSGIADRVAVICIKKHIRWLMSFGFQYKGPSDVVFAGGGWQNMVLEFPWQGYIAKV